MDSPATERCRAHLRTVSDLLPALDAALIPGSVERERHAPPGEDQVAAYRAERAERHLLKTKYLPESAAPADLDIVMALADIRTILSATYHDAEGLVGLPRRCRRCNHELEAHGGDKVGCGLCDPCPGYAFRYVSPGDQRWEALLVSGGESLAVAIEGPLQKVAEIARSAIGDHEHGWLMMAPCPWCEGKTPAMPGGSLTLRMYVPGIATEAYVLCLNPECTPSEEACGHRKRNRPMWPYHELDWLSDRIDDYLERKKADRERRAGGAAA